MPSRRLPYVVRRLDCLSLSHRCQEQTLSKLKPSFGCWNYDRTRALFDGTVQPDGIDLNYMSMPVEETFFRMLRNREFDAAELSLSSYTLSMFREPRPFIAIPVFPSRFFPHSPTTLHPHSAFHTLP